MNTTDLKINAKNPFSKEWSYPKQAEYLKAARNRKQVHIDSDGKCGIQFLNFVGGRGAAKSTTAILDLIYVALIDAPGFRTCWTARSNGEIDDVLLEELERLLPQHLYKVINKAGARRIEWITGSKTFLVSRSVDNPRKRVGLGKNIHGIYHDEMATGFSLDKLTDLNNAIREPGAPYKFCVTTSTPLPNGYEKFVHQEGSTTIVAGSRDNPHISKADIDSQALTMDEMTIRQEHYGEFVITTGRQWDGFVEAPWPEGNILEGATYNPDLPFHIGADLGSGQGAYQIVQHIEPRHPITGEKMFDGKLAVIVAEFTPNAMDFEEVLGRVIEEYCDGDHTKRAPISVLIGHDVKTKGNVGGSGAEYLRQLGWKYQRPKQKFFSKSTQKICARSLILNTAGERRFAVAANKNKQGKYVIDKQYFGDNKTRGILNVMRNDTYSDTSDSVFVKDKGRAGKNALEDDRDAFLYWVTCLHPVNFNLKIK